MQSRSSSRSRGATTAAAQGQPAFCMGSGGRPRGSRWMNSALTVRQTDPPPPTPQLPPCLDCGRTRVLGAVGLGSVLPISGCWHGRCAGIAQGSSLLAPPDQAGARGLLRLSHSSTSLPLPAVALAPAWVPPPLPTPDIARSCRGSAGRRRRFPSISTRSSRPGFRQQQPVSIRAAEWAVAQSVGESHWSCGARLWSAAGSVPASGEGGVLAAACKPARAGRRRRAGTWLPSRQPPRPPRPGRQRPSASRARPRAVA